ncbi:MAG TPA: hypothetical protein VGX51_11975 [Solirubrobacteraceae bacterium]|jgi:hypothetical protein|nr:hypothetical protein [Solirubrobacteraceae bacterium]
MNPAKPIRTLAAAALWALSAAALALAATAGAYDQTHGLEGTAPYDRGLEVSYCPRPHHKRAHRATPSPLPPAPPLETPASQPPVGSPPSEAPAGQPTPLASAASTSEAGWPKKECLKIDKGPAGRKNTLVGLDGVHNWLLGGYGNDTIVGGNHGDVIWGDYQPSGEPRSQTVKIYAGNGRNVIYANDTHNYVWTGNNAFTVVHAHISGIDGVIHCGSRYIVVYLSTVSERHFKLDGCYRISHYSVGY